MRPTWRVRPCQEEKEEDEEGERKRRIRKRRKEEEEERSRREKEGGGGKKGRKKERKEKKINLRLPLGTLQTFQNCPVVFWIGKIHHLPVTTILLGEQRNSNPPPKAALYVLRSLPTRNPAVGGKRKLSSGPGPGSARPRRSARDA